MKFRRILALGGAVAVLGLLGAASAFAAGTRVSVRVEGLRHTLLRATSVRTPTSGSITKAHMPPGVCPADSAAGAFNRATRGRWGGTYSSGLGIEVDTVLGETHKYSPHGYYWGIWVNDRFAQAGLCDLRLHRGDRLLLAPAPATGTISPIIVSVPRHVARGHRFTLRAWYINAKGHRTPLAGAAVNGRGRTNAHGKLTLRARRAGRDQLRVTHRGFVRDEATVTVVR